MKKLSSQSCTTRPCLGKSIEFTSDKLPPLRSVDLYKKLRETKWKVWFEVRESNPKAQINPDNANDLISVKICRVVEGG